jgi:hypothetical protein
MLAQACLQAPQLIRRRSGCLQSPAGLPDGLCRLSAELDPCCIDVHHPMGRGAEREDLRVWVRNAACDGLQKLGGTGHAPARVSAALELAASGDDVQFGHAVARRRGVALERPSRW